MVLDLQDLRLDASISEEIHYQAATVVGDADALDKAFVNKLFHCMPGLLKACFTGVEFTILVSEASRVFLCRINVGLSHREMYEEEVEVV